jgi:hypothetical protein
MQNRITARTGSPAFAPAEHVLIALGSLVVGWVDGAALAGY